MAQRTLQKNNPQRTTEDLQPKRKEASSSNHNQTKRTESIPNISQSSSAVHNSQIMSTSEEISPDEPKHQSPPKATHKSSGTAVVVLPEGQHSNQPSQPTKTTEDRMSSTVHSLLDLLSNIQLAASYLTQFCSMDLLDTDQLNEYEHILSGYNIMSSELLNKARDSEAGNEAEEIQLLVEEVIAAQRSLCSQLSIAKIHIVKHTQC